MFRRIEQAQIVYLPIMVDGKEIPGRKKARALLPGINEGDPAVTFRPTGQIFSAYEVARRSNAQSDQREGYGFAWGPFVGDDTESLVKRLMGIGQIWISEEPVWRREAQ